jgi:PAS domain-containing protein
MLKCFYGEDVTVLRVKRDITFTKLNSKLKAEYKKDMEVAYKDSDGDVIPITKSAHLKAAMKEADGRAVRLQLKPRDTVGVDGAINASEILLLDNFVDGCILINRRGVITFFSAAAEKLWGYTRREVLGKPIKILMPEQGTSPPLRHYAITMRIFPFAVLLEGIPYFVRVCLVTSFLHLSRAWTRVVVDADPYVLSS